MDGARGRRRREGVWVAGVLPVLTWAQCCYPKTFSYYVQTTQMVWSLNQEEDKQDKEKTLRRNERQMTLMVLPAGCPSAAILKPHVCKWQLTSAGWLILLTDQL